MVQQIPAQLIGKPFEKWELVIKESFNLKDLYVRLQKFLVDEGWTDMHNGKDNFEVRYHQTTDERNTKSYQIWWRAQKSPRFDGQGYYKFYLKLDIMPKFMGKKEMIVAGKKIELDSGELNIKCWLYLLENASGDEGWKTNWLLKLFKNQFWNQINADVKGKAMGELSGFNSDLYKFFQVNTGIRPGDDKRDFYMHPKGLEQR